MFWLVFAAIMEQGSRLSAVRLAQRHAVCDLLNLDAFDGEGLYAAMDWLEQRQGRVEKRSFNHRYGQEPPRLYLYDVTRCGRCKSVSTAETLSLSATGE